MIINKAHPSPVKPFLRNSIMKCFTYHIFCLIISICGLYSSYGQSAKQQLKLANAVTFEQSDFFEEIKIRDKHGYFIIPVRIGNELYEYIFDTGGYNTLTSEMMVKNTLPQLMEVEVGSSNQLKSKIALTKIPSIHIGEVEFQQVGAFNFDFDNSPQIDCYTNAGLIGKSIIKNAIWQINASKQSIILTDDINKLDHLDKAFKLKVKLDKIYNPFITVKINGEMKSFLLDFGYGGLISLTEETGSQLPANEIVEITGEGSVGANGMVNESMFIKQIESFEIGNIDLGRQEVYYSKSNNFNLIGTDITKYFILTLNFEEKELFLTPIEKENNTEVKTSYGFDLNRHENKTYVSRIYKNLSADQEGLKLNDVILSINDQELTDNSYCEFYDDKHELLEGNQNIRLKIKRGNKIISIEVTKSALFQSH